MSLTAFHSIKISNAAELSYLYQGKFKLDSVFEKRSFRKSCEKNMHTFRIENPYLFLGLHNWLVTVSHRPGGGNTAMKTLLENSVYYDLSNLIGKSYLLKTGLYTRHAINKNKPPSLKHI